MMLTIALRPGLWRSCSANDKQSAMYENCVNIEVGDMPSWLKAACACAIIGETHLYHLLRGCPHGSHAAVLAALVGAIMGLMGLCGNVAAYKALALLSVIVVIFDVAAPALWANNAKDESIYILLTGLGATAEYGFPFALAWVAAGLAVFNVPLALLAHKAN
jgi:hypothetical protein